MQLQTSIAPSAAPQESPRSIIRRHLVKKSFYSCRAFRLAIDDALKQHSIGRRDLDIAFGFTFGVTSRTLTDGRPSCVCLLAAVLGYAGSTSENDAVFKLAEQRQSEAA